MIKRTKLFSRISLLIIFIMMFSVISFAGSIGKVEEDEWVNKGWARLYETQDFQPSKNLTRGELVALINSLFNFKDRGEISFLDVPENSHYYKEVSKAFTAGYIVGRDKDTFDPETEVNNVEAYIMAARVLKLDTDQKPKQMLQFKDANEVPQWGMGYVEALAQKGLINDRNKVKPYENISGSEAVILLEKMFLEGENVVEEKEDKGGGKSPLNLQGAFFVSIDNNESVELGKIEEGNSSEDIIIKLVFDRGVIRDNWEHNKEQIKLQANNGTVIKSEVFRIENMDEEKSNIFIKPLEELKSGKKINIIIGKDLKANNGNSLGKDEVITFSIK